MINISLTEEQIKLSIKNKNLMLHAYKIKFMINNVKYNFKAKYDDNFETFLKKIFKFLNILIKFLTIFFQNF